MKVLWAPLLEIQSLQESLLHLRIQILHKSSAELQWVSKSALAVAATIAGDACSDRLAKFSLTLCGSFDCPLVRKLVVHRAVKI